MFIKFCDNENPIRNVDAKAKLLTVTIGIRFWFLFSVAIFCNTTSFVANAQTDNQAWLAISKVTYASGNHKLGFYAESRMRNDASETFAVFGGPVYRYQYNDHIELGLGLKYMRFKSNGDFKPFNRTEVEVTFKDKLDWGAVSLRNRWERIDGANVKPYHRFRHRLVLSTPIEMGPLRNLFFSNEVLYTADSGHFRLQQNRLVPIGTKFSLGAKSSLSVFYMIQYRNNTDGTSTNNHALGVTYSF